MTLRKQPQGQFYVFHFEIYTILMNQKIQTTLKLIKRRDLLCW